MKKIRTLPQPPQILLLKLIQLRSDRLERTNKKNIVMKLIWLFSYSSWKQTECGKKIEHTHIMLMLIDEILR